MALPSFYQSSQVGKLYTPNVNEAVRQGKALNLPNAADDEMRVALLLIDMQVDFIHEDGALYVPGAIEDTRRTVEWLFENVGNITTIFASLDSHVPLQIFSPAWWQDEDGEHPQPYTVISAEDVQTGRWTPIYQPEWSSRYVAALEGNHKKQLMIWPYHTLLGTPGHNLTPALYEAITYHAAARQAAPQFIMKGLQPESEHYSLFEPEVKLERLTNGGLDVERLKALANYDRVYVAGQAKSHCVLESVGSFMRYYEGQDAIIGKMRVLMDGMSSVQHPEIDFEGLATEAFTTFSQQGLTLTNTSDGLL